MRIKGRRIVVAICGGIAAYKAAALVSRLTQAGAEVRCAMTEHACQFITPLTFETLSHNRVITDTFNRETPFEVDHIAINKWAEAIVVAPATANIIGKAAGGIGDDFVSTMLLAATCPVCYAPAMNTAMYDNPVVRRNMETLREMGCFFLEPGAGKLACGDVGRGRMSEPEEIAEYLDRLLCAPRDMEGLKTVVTAGPTIERIDDVRFLSNRSSGKMGYAIAKAAMRRGAEVTLITGRTGITPPAGVKVVPVESAAEMYDAAIEAFDACDLMIKAAAVADYTPRVKIDGKLKKGGDMAVDLVRTRDILKELGQRKKGQVLVGFAAEAADLEQNAKKKLAEKNLDMIAANDISRGDIGFGADENSLTLYFADGRKVQLEKAAKEDIADSLLDEIVRLVVK